jgi:WD40 repeat protein
MENILIYSILAHEDYINTVLCMKSRPIFFTGSSDKTIKVWNIVYNHNLKKNTCILIHTIRDSSLGILYRNGVIPKGDIMVLKLTKNEDVLIVGTWENKIQLYDTNTFHKLQEIESDIKSVRNPRTLALRNGFFSLAFNPLENMLFAGTYDGSILIYNYERDRHNILFEIKAYKNELKKHKKCVRSLSFNPSGNKFLSGSYDGTLKIWDITSRLNIYKCL